VLVLGALIIALVMFSPEFAIFVAAYGYVFGGIIETVFFLQKGVKDVLEQETDDDEKDKEEDKVTLLPS